MNQELIFKPSYVWPNPAFHFRIYYQSGKVRIFLIENIVHNWEWLKKYGDRIQQNDYFFVQLGWYFGDWLTEECQRALDYLGLDKSRFRIMFPDFATKNLFESYGFSGYLINHNCFLDESIFNIKNIERIYDAVYVARFAPFKRHFLAANIPSLALVAGSTWGVEAKDIPSHKYLNEAPLDTEGVIQKISESKVGVILSEFEGACYSSSEYLLCGLPVVSTKSHGGRDVWYNDYNAIICDSNPEAVAEAVLRLGSLGRNREKVRSMHIQQSQYFRRNFIRMMQEVLELVSDNSIDVSEYVVKNFKHKLLTSETPDFESIFPRR